jgi:hypothetical protein
MRRKTKKNLQNHLSRNPSPHTLGEMVWLAHRVAEGRGLVAQLEEAPVVELHVLGKVHWTDLLAWR